MVDAAHTYSAVPLEPGGAPEVPQKRESKIISSAAEEQRKAILGAAKLLRTLRLDDTQNVETNSVYGLAIVMPQLARSAGWPFDLAMRGIRALLYTAVNIVVQVTFLYMISKEEDVLSGFAGQMYLCDMGAFVDRCPQDAGCTGPGGTRYTPERMYPFDQWTTRNFVRDSLKAIFPEKEHEIDERVDPGEYGLESYRCRILCCFLFMISLASEFFIIYNIAKILYIIPTRAESWIIYEPAENSEVGIKIAGMPLHWKMFNFIFILLPKFVLWFLTCETGMHFLLDTSGIVDVIANSVALGFILSLDELIFENLATSETKIMMNMVHGFNIYEKDHEDHHEGSEVETLEKEIEQKLNRCTWKGLLPTRLLFVLFLTMLFIASYYYLNCKRSNSGTWVPHDLYMPKATDYSFKEFLFPFFFHPETEGEQLLWAMPPEKEYVE